MSAYRGRGRRSSLSSRWMSLRYAGTCKVCGCPLPAGALAFWDAGARTVTCERIDCAAADGLTTNKPLTGPWDQRARTKRGGDDGSDHDVSFLRGVDALSASRNPQTNRLWAAGRLNACRGDGSAPARRTRRKTGRN